MGTYVTISSWRLVQVVVSLDFGLQISADNKLTTSTYHYDRGADIIIASSVIQPLRESYSGSRDQMSNILQIVFNIYSAVEAQVVEDQLPLIDVLIQHKVSAKHTLDFEQVQDLVRMGEITARQMLPTIKEAIEIPPEM
jgi:predicted acylesterase/phospholipase RssA